MTNDLTPFQQSPYLRQQRNFPSDKPQALTVEIDRSYIDIATKVNARTIGIFPTNFAMVTGEQWFLNGQAQKQQTLRQVYQISSYSAVNHGLDFNNISIFTVIRGIGFDGTNYFPLPYVSSVVANQVGMYVTPTQIIFNPGGAPPAITRGLVVLEWMSNF